VEPARTTRDELPAAGFPLVGSEVLDVIGSGGVPKREMHDIIHSSEVGERRLGPLQAESVSFRADPEVGDAGAEFAEEFGQNYLRSATTGEDVSELENPTETSPTEIGGPFLVETPKPSPKTARRRHRHRPRA
jgi:hypothetical protein